jgi:hypothetical protein
MSFVGYLPADEARVVRIGSGIGLLREDALRALTPVERAALGPAYGCVEDYDPVLRAHCRL